MTAGRSRSRGDAILAMSGLAASCGRSLPPGRGHVQHPGRKPCLEAQLAQAECTERRQARRLEDNGVAAGQGGAEFPGCDHHGEVPGHDQSHHTEGLAQRDIETGLGALYRFPKELVGGPGVIAQRVGDVVGLPPRVADGLADVAGLERRQFLPVGPHHGRKAKQDLCPRDGGLSRPVGKGLARRRDRLIQLRRPRRGHLGHRLGPGGFGHTDRAGARGRRSQ